MPDDKNRRKPNQPPPAVKPGSAWRYRPGSEGNLPPRPPNERYGYQGPPRNATPPVGNGRPYAPQGNRPPRLDADGGYAPRPPAPKPRRPGFGLILGFVLLALLALAALFGLYLVTRSYALLNGISVQRTDSNGNAVAADPNITGRDSINILLLGLDTRPGAPDGTRSDTMILVRVDPKTKGASLLSLPRDMWVPIPGHGSQRINAAYFFGDQERPGTGGPPLAKQTVAQDFGVPVDYYAQVDFTGFESVVNAIGGVTVDVQKPLIDNEYPTTDYGIKRLFIPAGLQHMDGTLALEYARSRHADSDLGRNQRQQQVLLAIRENAANIGIVGKLDGLSSALQGTVKTDLSPGEIVALVQLATGINKANVHNFAIDANMVTNQTIDGNAVLVPDMTAVHALIQKFEAATRQ